MSGRPCKIACLSAPFTALGQLHPSRRQVFKISKKPEISLYLALSDSEEVLNDSKLSGLHRFQRQQYRFMEIKFIGYNPGWRYCERSRVEKNGQKYVFTRVPLCYCNIKFLSDWYETRKLNSDSITIALYVSTIYHIAIAVSWPASAAFSVMLAMDGVRGSTRTPITVSPRKA